jgi:hypothetical protein
MNIKWTRERALKGIQERIDKIVNNYQEEIKFKYNINNEVKKKASCGRVR